MRNQPFSQLNFIRQQAIHRRRGKHQRLQILLRHARHPGLPRIKRHRLLRIAGRLSRQIGLAETAPQILANRPITVFDPFQLGRTRGDQARGEQRQRRRKRLAVLRIFLDALKTARVKTADLAPVVVAHPPQTALLALRQPGRMQIVARQATNVHLRHFVELPDHIEIMLSTKIVSRLQRLEPAINLIDGLEGIIQRDFTDDTLEFLGITERVIRA